MQTTVCDGSHIETVVFGCTTPKSLKIHCTKVINMKKICYSDFINLFLTSSSQHYLSKINNKNTRKRCDICSKLTIMMFLLLTLHMFHTFFQSFYCLLRTRVSQYCRTNADFFSVLFTSVLTKFPLFFPINLEICNSKINVDFFLAASQFFFFFVFFCLCSLFFIVAVVLFLLPCFILFLSIFSYCRQKPRSADHLTLKRGLQDEFF